MYLQSACIYSFVVGLNSSLKEVGVSSREYHRPDVPQLSIVRLAYIIVSVVFLWFDGATACGLRLAAPLGEFEDAIKLLLEAASHKPQAVSHSTACYQGFIYRSG